MAMFIFLLPTSTVSIEVPPVFWTASLDQIGRAQIMKGDTLMD